MRYHFILGPIVGVLVAVCAQFAADYGFINWIIFLSWAGYFATGGKKLGLAKAVISTAVGYIAGYTAFELASMSTMSNPLLLPIGIILCIICFLGEIRIFFVPSAVLACAAYLGSGALPWETSISLLLGLLLGAVSEILATAVFNKFSSQA